MTIDALRTVGVALVAVVSLAACGSAHGSRVDLATPRFSHPTPITNPLFPISELTQVIQLGEEANQPLRVEVTLLPETRVFDWDGQRVETLVSQYVAYRGGRILEVAVDYYAQADDGAVWYFGEDVDNYRDGRVADHHGSWLAGRDGPPGMIMPAHPRTGDVYRPENIPGLVFEEVTVLEARGEMLRVEEHLMEGDIEHKEFSPGYGEFRALAPDEMLTVALAVPVDALGGPAPGALAELRRGATDVLQPSPDWAGLPAVAAASSRMWEPLAAGAPELLRAEMTTALAALTAAVDVRDLRAAHAAAMTVAQAGLDLQLRHQAPPQVDLQRLGLWARQVVVDAASGDGAAVSGDVAVLETIWRRAHQAADPAGAWRVTDLLARLQAAAESGDLPAAARAAEGLSDL